MIWMIAVLDLLTDVLIAIVILTMNLWEQTVHVSLCTYKQQPGLFF